MADRPIEPRAAVSMPYRKIGHRARVRRFCYVLVGRRKGEEENNSFLPSGQYRCLSERLSGRCIYTELADESLPYKWIDVWRLPFKGKTLNHIRAILRKSNLFDGPYYGEGEVLRPTGQGELKASQQSAGLRRAFYRSLERDGSFELLDLRAFVLPDRSPVWLNIVSLAVRNEPIDDNWRDHGELWFKFYRNYLSFASYVERENDKAAMAAQTPKGMIKGSKERAEQVIWQDCHNYLQSKK